MRHAFVRFLMRNSRAYPEAVKVKTSKVDMRFPKLVQLRPKSLTGATFRGHEAVEIMSSIIFVINNIGSAVKPIYKVARAGVILHDPIFGHSVDPQQIASTSAARRIV